MATRFAVNLTHGQTIDLVYRRATFSVQFYRAGAIDNANRFDFWVMSENGLTYAETAFPDGRISHVRLLNGGSGYTTAPTVTFTGLGGGGARATTSIFAGTVTGITLLDFGSGYTSPPDVNLLGGGGSGATASAQGMGLRVLFPLTIRRLDLIVGDAFEERTQIDLGIDYAANLVQDTGEIDVIECDVTIGADREIGEVALA